MSGSVPHLQAVVESVPDQVFYVEVDAHCVLMCGSVYVVCLIEAVRGVAINDGGFSNCSVAEEDDAELGGVTVGVRGGYAHYNNYRCWTTDRIDGGLLVR